MERHASALKAARQAIKRRNHNQTIRSQCRTVVKNVRQAIGTGKLSKENLEKVQGLLSQAQKTLMKAASKNVMKRETAARYISRLSSAMHRATK